MAKLGEGDDRWIVKERDDGKNCNGWHWSEVNLNDWSKERLKELLCVAIVDDSKGTCKVTEMEKCSGDVTVQSRKQKKFPLYELEIVLKWEGQLLDAEVHACHLHTSSQSTRAVPLLASHTHAAPRGPQGGTKLEAKGKVKIPDLSEETYDDLEMTVTVEDETDAKRPLKEMVRKQGGTAIRKACMQFVKELKDNVGMGKEMPVKKAPSERVNNTYVVSSTEQKKTSDLKITYDFVPHPKVLYETLLDTDRIRGCTASDAKMSREVGGKFMMFSNAVDGENLELREYSDSSGDALIKWKWRFATWQPGHYSTVTITLTDKDGSTKLELVQTGVPEEERERTEKGWKGLLFERMKAMLGGSIMG